MAMLTARTLGVRGRFDDEIVAKQETARVKNASRKRAFASGLIEFCRGLVDAGIEAFPEDTSTKRNE
eukprot:6462656-Pyramimonas_sp.AAC.1